MITYLFFLLLALPWALIRSRNRGLAFSAVLPWCAGMTFLFVSAAAALYAAMTTTNQNYLWVFLIFVVLIGLALNKSNKKNQV